MGNGGNVCTAVFVSITLWVERAAVSLPRNRNRARVFNKKL
jgi:hypothetical protein